MAGVAANHEFAGDWWMAAASAEQKSTWILVGGYAESSVQPRGRCERLHGLLRGSTSVQFTKRGPQALFHLLERVSPSSTI